MRPDNMPRPFAPEHSEPANWIVEALRSQALEIAREGHKGWGNTMTIAADEIERLRGEVERLLKSDSDAAQYVESVICMRTAFTGDPPYVGWRGLGLALNERLDRAENAESSLAELRMQLMRATLAASNDARRITFLESLCEHEWKLQDDSFDHEFGTERVVYDECYTCGATRDPTQD